MKKIISLLVVFCMMFSAVTVNAEEENINVEVGEKILTKDVDYTLTYYDNVKVGKATVVVTFIGNYAGEKEQTFNIVKRKASSSSKKEDKDENAEEVQEDNVINNNVENVHKAYISGYIDGYEDGTFRPYKNITRAEAVKIINCALGREDFGNEENPFADVEKSHWAYKHILEAVEHTEK